MNWLFRIFVFVGALVVVALFSALIAPYFVNWERFTKEFESQATRIVGQQVKVGGKSNLRLLPLPYISFQDLEIGRNADGSPLMTVERFSLYAELLPFLSGEVRIVEILMQHPSVNLQVAPNGTIAWTSPQQAIVDPEQVNIEKLTVRDGNMVINGLAGGRTLSIEELDGEFTARSVIGPWRIDANAEIEGLKTQLKISTGSYQRSEKSLRVRLEASRADYPYTLAIDGPIKLDDEILNWDGEFTLSPFSQAQTAGLDRVAPPLPVHTEGVFSASPLEIGVDEYRMEIGQRDDPYVMTGNGSLQFREEIFFRMTADGRQIDLDRIEGEGTYQGKNLEARLEVLKSILDRIPVPEANGEIDAILPAVVAGDTFIRDIKAKVRPFGSGWEVRSFQAIFPGNTLVEAEGRVGVGDEFGFAGEMLVASRQPSGFSSWISGGVDAQIRRLKRFGFSSRVTLSRNQATLDDLELRLDDALLKGKLQRLAPVDGRYALIVELAGTRVNLQDLQALYSLVKEKGEGSDVSEHDLNVRISADELQAAIGDVPLTAKAVDAQFRVQDGDFSVEQFDAGDFYGAKILSAGRLERALERPNGNFKLDIEAADATRLLGFVREFTGAHSLLDALQADPELTRDTTLHLELDARSRQKGAKGQLLVTGLVGKTKVNSRVSFNGDLVAKRDIMLDVDTSLESPSAMKLMRQLAIETLPAELVGEGPGPVSAKAYLAGKIAEGFDARLTVNAPDTIASALGKLRLIDDGDIGADMAVTIGSEDVTPYLVVMGITLPGVGLGEELPVSLELSMQRDQRKMKFVGIKGQVAGNRVSGELEYQFAGIERPRVSGSVNLATLPIEAVGDSVFGFSDLLGNAGVLDQGEREFQKPLFAGTDARLEISAERFETGLGLDGTDAKAELVMLDGAIDLNDLEFRAAGGEVGADISIRNADGQGIARMGYRLKDMDLARLLSEFGAGQVANGLLTVNGSAEANGRTINAMISNLSGNGIVFGKNLTLEGINPNSLDAILLQSDVEGFEANSQSVQEVVEEEVLQSGFSIGEVDAPYSLSRGRLRINNVVLELDQARLNGDLLLSLPDNELKIETTLFFEPGIRDAIKGADPVIRLTWEGPFDNPQVKTDTGQLEGYLALRAFEASQRRIETLEAQVLEKQRIQREIAFSFAREKYRIRAEEEALRLKEELQKRYEGEELKRLEKAVQELEEERKRAAEEARAEAERKKQEEIRLKEEARKLAEEQRRVQEAAKANSQSETRSRAGGAIEESELPPLQERIIDSIENFLNSNQAQ